MSDPATEPPELAKPIGDLFDYATKRQVLRKPPATGRYYLPGHPRYAAQQRAANPPVSSDDELNDEIGF